MKSDCRPQSMFYVSKATGQGTVAGTLSEQRPGVKGIHMK